MTFSNELDILIKKSNTSKNRIIKETGIDRSSFFQILNGRRFPSESAFRSLLLFFIDHTMNKSDKSVISQRDLDHFLQSYLYKSLSKSQYDRWKISADFIQVVNEALSSQKNDSVSSAISKNDQEVSNFITRQVQASNGVLKFYLSLELIDRFHVKETIFRNIHSDLTIQQLSGIYQNTSAEYAASLLKFLAKSIGFLDQQPFNYSIFYTDDSAKGKQNILFPYYLIGTNEAFLLSADGNESFLITKKEDVEIVQKRFDEILTHSAPLFTQEKNYMGLAQRLYMKYQNDEFQQIYSAAERPCFLEIATPPILSKYAPTPEIEQFATDYLSVIQSMPNFYALNSFDGVKQFEKDHQVTEAGMNFQMDDHDMAVLQAQYDKVLWDKIILLPFSNCFIRNWEIAIYYPDTIFFSRYDNTDFIICIHDRNIIDTLFTYYNSMFRLLHK